MYNQIYNVIMVKTASEIQLKSDPVRVQFMNTLRQNIRYRFQKDGIEAKISSGSGRLYLASEDLEKVYNSLQLVFGIHSISFARLDEFETKEDLVQKVLNYFSKVRNNEQTFSIRARREGKHDFSSKDIETACGSKILDEFKDLKVNLSNPQLEIQIEINNNKIVLYHEQIDGLKGLPAGVEGYVFVYPKGSDKDLNLSAFLMMKRGCNICYLKETEKVLVLILKYFNGNELVLDEKFSEKLVADLQNIVKKDLQAIVIADTALDEKSLKQYSDFDRKSEFVVLRPILGLPENVKQKYLQIIK